MPAEAKIDIYSLGGVFVRSIDKHDASQFAQWDLKNQYGYPVASGMYVARITSGGEVILGPDATVSPVATLHVRSQGDVSGTLGSAPANIMIEAVTGNNWSSGEAGAELLFKKGGDITVAIRNDND